MERGLVRVLADFGVVKWKSVQVGSASWQSDCGWMFFSGDITFLDIPEYHKP
jgi:hypothetical protein